ncbi:MFS transporter [Croceicoccus sp. F390]|uniref:MFS transporter n=1 Tax=Croceicoccus esteveae TaxID=3075597 RepID=A0ABU2ZI17_9SPHN|nr:MFS transporter [Croceicoccus sp. F390]MDT0575944.1 MFS transporter [Croceicoccus sp. F390]
MKNAAVAANETPAPPRSPTSDTSAVGLFGRAALIAFAVMSGVANGTLSPLLPQIEREFGTVHGNVTVTMALTVLGLGILLGSLLGGWLSDRFSRRLVMAISALVYGAAGCGIIFATSLEHVIVGRFILGIALGTMGVATFAVIGDFWDENGRNLWSGLIPAAGALAGMGLSVVAGMMADTSWRGSFLIYGVGFIAAMLSLAGIPAKRTASTRQEEVVQGVPLALLPPIILLGLIAGSIATGTAAYLPHRLADVGVDSSSGRAIAALSGAAAVVIVGFAYSRIRRFVSLDMAFVLGAAASATGLVIMAYGSSPFIVSFGMGVEGIGIGLFMPSLMVYAIERSNENNRGRVVGLMKGAIFGGPFFVQFVLEPVRLSSGASPVLAILAASAVALAIYFGIRWAQRRAPVPA